MLAFAGDIVAGWKFLDDLDIGSKACPGEDPLEEIVAQQRVLGNSASESGFEGIDIVNALAGIGALAEKILVDVGNRRRIGIHAPRTGEDPLIEGTLAADRQRRRDARLKNGVTVDDTLQGFVEFRPIQRMGHLADKPECRISRQSRIAIKGDDVSHIGRHLRHVSGDGHERRVAGTAQQPVEFMQLAPFAFPSHPFVFARIEDATAVQKEETTAAGARPVATVQPFDRRCSHGEQVGVTRQDFLVRVDPVRKKGKGEIAADTGKMVEPPVVRSAPRGRLRWSAVSARRRAFAEIAERLP